MRTFTYWRVATLVAVALVISIVSLPSVGPALAAAQPPSPQSATTLGFTTLATYHNDLARDGYAPLETISESQAAGLHSLWTENAGAIISDEAAVVDGVAFWGDWNGIEHATASNGTDLWTTNLGTTYDPSCGPPPLGVTSSATVASIGGVPLLWTGTGNGMVAELNALNGHILWETRVEPASGGFEWSSPALYGGDIYVGISSVGDCPLIRGGVVQLNALSGKVISFFYTTTASCPGASVWSSPAIDTTTKSLFVTTGNASCSDDPLSDAIVQLSAANLALEGSWQILPTQNIPDGDWGATPTLFSAEINGVDTPLVGSADKNGVFYALKRSDLAAGPIWWLSIAQAGACPECGQGSVSPAAFDGNTLYVAGGETTIGGAQCAGSLRALDPANGKIEWQDCLGGTDLSPVSVTPGLVFVTDGSQILCVSATSGAQIWSFTDTSGDQFGGGPVVAGDVLYAGNSDGNMYAFATTPAAM